MVQEGSEQHQYRQRPRPENSRMDLLSSLFGGLCSLLCDGLGRFVLRLVSRGRFPGESAYWDGLCEIIGLFTTITCIIAIVVLVYALTS